MSDNDTDATMSATAPWTVKGISPELRKRVKEAAARDGVTVATWLDRATLGSSIVPVAPVASIVSADAGPPGAPVAPIMLPYPQADLLRVLSELVADNDMPEVVRKSAKATLGRLLVRARKREGTPAAATTGRTAVAVSTGGARAG